MLGRDGGSGAHAGERRRQSVAPARQSMTAPPGEPPYCLPAQPQLQSFSSPQSIPHRPSAGADVNDEDHKHGLPRQVSPVETTCTADDRGVGGSGSSKNIFFSSSPPFSSTSIPALSPTTPSKTPPVPSPSSVSSSSTIKARSSSPIASRTSSFSLPIPPPTPPRSPLLSIPSSLSSSPSSTSSFNRRSQSGSRTRDKSGWAASEDPDLAAARRALWEDDIHDSKKDLDLASQRQPSPESVSDALEGLSIGSTDDRNKTKPGIAAPEPESSFPILNCPHEPAHTTMVPRMSCLRRASSHSSSSSTSLSSSFSPFSAEDCIATEQDTHLATSEVIDQQTYSSPSTSLSSSNISVQFSTAPPAEFPTHSPTEYERRGEGPVEKLTIREWVELRDVREAVGVWSGRIAKWEGSEVTSDTATTTADPTGSTPDGEDLSASHRRAGSAAALNGQRRDSAERALTKKSSYGSLAAVVGVVTVGNNSTYSSSGRASYPNLEPPSASSL